jgi:hypothetical protein
LSIAVDQQQLRQNWIKFWIKPEMKLSTTNKNKFQVQVVTAIAVTTVTTSCCITSFLQSALHFTENLNLADFMARNSDLAEISDPAHP